MGKAVKIIATAALVVGASIVTFNPGTGAAIAGALSAASGVAISTAAVITAAGVASSIGIAGLQRNLMGGASRAALSVFDPASINPDKNAFRKISFGRTLFAMDLRYAEPSADAEQAYFEYVFALAGHRCESLDQIYIDEKLAWSGGAASGEFANYLWVEFIPEAGPSAYHTVHGGTKWAANQRLTGCATMKVRIRRTALNKNTASPFTNGLYGRWSAIGKGMPVYDPALDSTVPGGSGTQRANDCTTWRYTAGGIDRGNNPALQELAYFLGWTCMGKTMVGLGIAASLFNLPSFAVGAAISDEAIAIVGGSQRRYESGRTFSDGDDPKAVRDELNQAMNAELVHDGGKLALRLGVNDLIPQITLSEDDFLSGYSWEAIPQRDQQYTVVRGRFTQPGAPALFQMADIPEVLTGMASVAPRPLAVDLSPVQNIIRGERIITQIARRVAWNGRFRVRLGIRAWAMHQNIVAAVDIPHREWDGKLFRARVLALNNDCTVDVELRPEAVDIYLPPTTPTGNITPENPIPILSQNMLGWLAAGLAPGATRNVGRGPWASGVDYDVGDFVSSGGNAYECVTAHTSSGGDEPPSAFWQLLIPGGTAGVDGDNVAVVTIFKRAAVAPAGPSGDLIFDFNGTLTEATGGAANGWTLEHQDSDGNPEWSRQAGARNAGASDTITPGEWSVSKKVVQDGAPGADGADGAPGIPGTDGAAGLPGAPGANGISSYLHIAYADSSDGVTNFTTGAPGARTYVGTLVDSNPTDSTNPALYSWSKFVGSDGANGTPGAPGANGQPSYVHIAYATNSTGTAGFSTTDSVGKTYVGFYTDQTLADSTNPALYSWSLIKGADGSDGAPGPDGITPSGGVTINVSATSGGTINPGELPRAFTVKLMQGAADVTGTATWSVESPTSVSVTVVSAGSFELTALSAERGSAVLRGTIGAASYDIPFSAQKVRAGPSGISNSVSASFPATTSYTLLGETGDIVLPAGRPAAVSGSITWESTGSTSAQAYLEVSYDGGSSWSALGSVASGVTFPGEPSGGASLYETISATGAVRVVRGRMWGRRSSGSVFNSTSADLGVFAL